MLCTPDHQQAQPVLLWLYPIHAKEADQPLVDHYNVSQVDIVKEIDLFCRSKVGDTVELAPFATGEAFRAAS
ncbi:MAG: hypothetical protein IPO87_15190 [Flavobacteriales bacterium]|nr:hypothetical protein [Flavobacteriales bacterium]